MRVVSMSDIDSVHRLHAKEAKDRLGANSMAPESLLIKPMTDMVSSFAYKYIILNDSSYSMLAKTANFWPRFGQIFTG